VRRCEIDFQNTLFCPARDRSTPQRQRQFQRLAETTNAAARANRETGSPANLLVMVEAPRGAYLRRLSAVRSITSRSAPQSGPAMAAEFRIPPPRPPTRQATGATHVRVEGSESMRVTGRALQPGARPSGRKTGWPARDRTASPDRQPKTARFRGSAARYRAMRKFGCVWFRRYFRKRAPVLAIEYAQNCQLRIRPAGKWRSIIISGFFPALFRRFSTTPGGKNGRRGRGVNQRIVRRQIDPSATLMFSEPS